MHIASCFLHRICWVCRICHLHPLSPESFIRFSLSSMWHIFTKPEHLNVNFSVVHKLILTFQDIKEDSVYSNKSTNQMHQIYQPYWLSFKYSSTCFGHPHAHHQVDRPRPTTLLPPRSNSKPEAATAVDKLLMMGMRMPETCWAVFKRQALNLRDWCICLVDLFEYVYDNFSMIISSL